MGNSAWWFPDTLNQGLQSEPPEVRAGDTVSWTVNYPAYPASAGWTLHYALNDGKQGTIKFDAVADGDQFKITEDTTEWGAGDFAFQGYVDNAASERHTVTTGRIRVLPDLTGDPVDSRSHNRRVLDSIYAILEGRGDENKYTIGGRSIEKMSRAELETERRRYEWLVAREQGMAPAYFGAIFRRP